MEGRNIEIEVHTVPGANVANDFRAAAKELVARAPDAILALPMTPAQALRDETRTIPIVFLLSNDPVAEGLVASFTRPGGNITGFTESEYSLGGKLMQLLKQMAPEMTRVAVVHGLDYVAQSRVIAPTLHLYFDSIKKSAQASRIEVIETTLRDDADIAVAMDAFSRESHGGLMFPPDTFTVGHRAPLIAAVARLRLPAIYFSRIFVADGGLMSYGPDIRDLFRQAGGYVDRILRGTAPADLPVQTPTKFELVINIKAAQAIGLAVPPLLLTGADEVIE